MTHPGSWPSFPDPESSLDRRILDGVRAHGWYFITVAASEADPAVEDDPVLGAPFVYTVGLSITQSHPELILVGNWSHGPAILKAIYNQISAGAKLRAGEFTDALFDDRSVGFGDVSPHNSRALLTYADWITSRRGFSALQVIIQDSHRRWPTDAAYSGVRQPLLSAAQPPT